MRVKPPEHKRTLWRIVIEMDTESYNRMPDVYSISSNGRIMKIERVGEYQP